MSARQAALIASLLAAPMIGGAVWLWMDRGWLIVVDLAASAASALCP